ncbi:Clavaminate synthase-like protein [Multifurca ochricompacta]|uniref:Clavaminate synthase-like protein n=1 Tax=Multifurca ochricompacta TaxID=376703 RepID=A0AAD4QNZ6_9AGAM|nr:Clavaminate synthase-like protein [Multifurca ochricompacta]
MPGQVSLGSYTFVPETKENLDWAELITLDLSKYNTSEGKHELAQFLIKALREKGFFYVKNFNISQEAVNRQFSVGRELYELPLEEKLKYVPEGLDQGQFNGYVPAGRRILDEKSGIRDRVEIYNIPSALLTSPPSLIQDNIEEIEQFAKLLHSEVLDPLHTLLAIALELPEDYFRNIHKYEVKSEDHLRYMKYTKFSSEENEALGNKWVRGHTDLGSFTLLFRQPVAALQIRDPVHNEWKWVKPQDATLTVNACDAISFLTGGYVKSTIHRVVAPPKDQQHVDRLGLLYFSRPHNDVVLKTVAESPVLQREGFTQNEFEKSGNPTPTVEAWTFAKQKWQRRKDVTIEDKEHRTAQILPGFREQIYV